MIFGMIICIKSEGRCGKSTIKRIVFQNQEPSISLMLENAVLSDNGTTVVALNSFMTLQITTAGHERNSDVNLYEGLKSIIFVVDLLDDYLMAITELCKLIETVKSTGSTAIHFDVFLHKSDGLDPKARQQVLKDISSQVHDELGSPETFSAPSVWFHLTSLYDYSILHAISKVVQRHLVNGAILAGLLDDLCKKLGFTHAYLLDFVSKIYLSADSSSYEASAYELCNDALDVVCDFAAIYSPAKPEAPCSPVAEIVLDDETQLVYVTLGQGLVLLLYSEQTVETDALEEPISVYKRELFKVLK